MHNHALSATSCGNEWETRQLKTMTINGEQVIIIMIEVNGDAEHRIQPPKLLKATEPATRHTGMPAMHPNDTPESPQRPSKVTQESPGAPQGDRDAQRPTREAPRRPQESTRGKPRFRKISINAGSYPRLLKKT